VLCLNDLNQPYVAVYQLNVTTGSGDALKIAEELQSWVGKREVIEPFKFTVDSSCVTRISSVDEDLCQCTSKCVLC